MPEIITPAHRIVEAMGTTWDQEGHRPPRNWHISCSCGWRDAGLPGQIEAYDAWQAHAAHPEETTDA